MHYQTPTYETMFFAMKNLRKFCESNGLIKIALLKIDNEYDQLDWTQVRTMKRYVFKNSIIKIMIYSMDFYSKEEKSNIIKDFIQLHWEVTKVYLALLRESNNTIIGKV
jgi:hypothetical protein